MSKEQIITFLQKLDTKQYLRSHQMKHLWLAGSYSRGTQSEDSDIDIVYDFDTIQEMKDRGIISGKVFLEEKLGKSVDILDKNCIDPLIKENILSSAISIW